MKTWNELVQDWQTLLDNYSDDLLRAVTSRDSFRKMARRRIFSFVERVECVILAEQCQHTIDKCIEHIKIVRTALTQARHNRREEIDNGKNG